MKYEVYEDLSDPRSWRVEGFDDQAGHHLAVFSGPEARERAEEYATWISRHRRIIDQEEQWG
jgi:hypothetical protein